MALRQDKLFQVEVENCEFEGRVLRLVTGWVRGKNGNRMLTRLTSLPLKTGRYRKGIPTEIRALLFSRAREFNLMETEEKPLERR
ncbi:MAG: hypothetical protein ABS95_02420 [Verrucomicrobia bacterium SCN 57-15]|nr:MAG: hypothetical protein ABS95_02420 [Verrucomicrobia bacterium SCN 57-15]